MKDFAKKYRVLSIVLACLQNMTLGGIFYGWASISGGLLVSSTSEGGPGLSPDYVHMIFVIASFCNFLGPLVLGFILDSYGPRACSVVSILLITAGSAMFGLSKENSMPLFIPGMCLIAFGGPGTQNAIIHLSNLFPEWKATATSFIVGSFQLSFIVFLVFDTLWSTGSYSYSTLFTGYAVLCSLNLIVSLLLWPDEPFCLEEEAPEIAAVEEVQEHSRAPRPPAPLIHMARIRLPSVMVHRPHSHPHTPRTPSDQGQGSGKGQSQSQGYQCQDGSHSHSHSPQPDALPMHTDKYLHKQQEQLRLLQTSPLPPPGSVSQLSPLSSAESTESDALIGNAAANSVDLKDASFNQQIMSSEFLLLTFFFLVNSFWANFYIGTFDMQLGDKHSLTPEQRHGFAQTFTLVITLGVLAIPPVGALMDRQGFPVTAVVCIVSGLLWAVLLLADSPTRHLLVASFVFYSIYRTALYTFFFAYLADVLGFRYFGMMGGIIFLLAGVCGMLQYPLALYGAGTCHIFTEDQATCDQGNWASVNTVMLFMLSSTLYFVYQDYVRREKATKDAQSRLTVTAGGGSARIELTSTPYGAV